MQQLRSLYRQCPVQCVRIYRWRNHNVITSLNIATCYRTNVCNLSESPRTSAVVCYQNKNSLAKVYLYFEFKLSNTNKIHSLWGKYVINFDFINSNMFWFDSMMMIPCESKHIEVGTVKKTIRDFPYILWIKFVGMII